MQRREGCDVAIMAIGRMVGVAMQAAEQLAAENIEVSVYDMRWVKPIDKEAIVKACDTKLIVTLEDGTVVGGFGSAVSEVVSSAQLNQITPSVPPVLTLGFPDTFVQHGSEDELFNDFGLSAPQIAQRIKAALLAQR